ncbi:1369_t:CDS:2 [Cetraspora pellucida]|uniref:1369_t:CDS:1 n=1 Tax=Cetraspora pellucida TaxID=1433469 RepID=A0A9N8ZYA2_9GLOM|nr:1369_t:CDS:2 [Cetraspora pellucida]
MTLINVIGITVIKKPRPLFQSLIYRCRKINVIELRPIVKTSLQQDITSDINLSAPIIIKKAKKGGPTFDEVWDYFVKGEQDIQKYWHNKFVNDSHAYSKNSQLKAILPVQVSNDYDRIILKAWTVTNILFELLDKEFALVQNAVDNELDNAKHLTLSICKLKAFNLASIDNYIVGKKEESKEYKSNDNETLS